MGRVLACLIAVAMLAGCARETQSAQWPDDFNAENLDEVCGLFADEVVLAYPDSPDRDRDEFCGQMRALFDDPNRTFTYAQPDIRDVLVDGDLATVQLVWTLTVRDPSGGVVEIVEEDGLDVFARQPDGSWKIRVSHASRSSFGRGCPCGAGAVYNVCCGPLTTASGRPGTAEELMRSRYAAYARGDVERRGGRWFYVDGVVT